MHRKVQFLRNVGIDDRANDRCIGYPMNPSSPTYIFYTNCSVNLNNSNDTILFLIRCAHYSKIELEIQVSIRDFHKVRFLP